MENILKLARQAGIPEAYIEQYGPYKAKLNLELLTANSQADGKLVLVTAINPTPAGEGKTTVTIGLHEGLRALGKNSLVALREPALGPVFGAKGGATGGGKAQVVPAAEINLHFTGDMHAITAAANLLAAIIDNHIYWGNALNIDPERITWKRCLDVNDRQLRHITGGLGSNKDGVPHSAAFEITARSEIMAVVCLASSLADLKERLSRIIVAYTYDGDLVTVKDLQIEGALAVLLKDAMKPNIVQTLEGNLALIHGGPFANIAHGCNSVIATKMALKLADITITEAGFGADLGAEKFFDIKCRQSNLQPDAVVIVATVRALKMHGGAALADLTAVNSAALTKGMQNLRKHIQNITGIFHLPCVVAINKFADDQAEELALIQTACADLGVKAVVTDVFAAGSQGALALAAEVLQLLEAETVSATNAEAKVEVETAGEKSTVKSSSFSFAYACEQDIKSKILDIVQRVYGGKDVSYAEHLTDFISWLDQSAYRNLPVCIAKTPYSFSDDPKQLGLAQDFTLQITDLSISAGAGFIVAFAGNVMGMPGLGKNPAAFKMDLTDSGEIIGVC